MNEDTTSVAQSDVTEDVNTSPASSPETETAQTSQEVQPTPEQAEAGSKSVPEVNRMAERARKAEKEAEQLRAEIETSRRNAPQPEQNPQLEQVKTELKKLGFVTREEQDAELRRREEDLHVSNELTRLEGHYNGNDGRPKFDRQEVIEYALQTQVGNLEAAYKLLHEDALTDWRIKQAISQSRGVKTEASDGSGSQEVGTTNSDLKDAIAKGSKDALHTFLKRQFSKEG